MAEPVKQLKHRGPTKGAPKETKPSAKFTLSDYELCIAWLEKPGNLEKVEGVEGKTKVGGKVIVKSKAYEELAAYVNANQKKGSTLREVTGKSMKNRWAHFFDKYRRVKDETNATGWGLTEEDAKLGITTVEEKREYLCPLYHKVHALFVDNAKATNGIGDYDSVLNPEDEGVVNFPWSVVPDSNPPELNVEYAVVHTSISSGIEVQLTGGGSGDQIAGLEGAQGSMNLEDVNVNVHDGQQREPHPNPVGNGGRQEDNPSPSEGSPIDLEEEDDLESPDRISENIEPREGTAPTSGNVATSRGNKKRSRATSASAGGNQKSYPSKKQVDNNRHSMNVAFADNLGSINDTKLKLAEIEEKKLIYQSESDERKDRAAIERFTWEKERVEQERTWEKERVEQERTDRREAAAIFAKEQLKQSALGAALGSNRSLDEIAAIYNLFQ